MHYLEKFNSPQYKIISRGILKLPNTTTTKKHSLEGNIQSVCKKMREVLFFRKKSYENVTMNLFLSHSSSKGSPLYGFMVSVVFYPPLVWFSILPFPHSMVLWLLWFSILPFPHPQLLTHTYFSKKVFMYEEVARFTTY